MEFHLYLANHHPQNLVLMEDLVRPIIVGLEELGHTVASFSTELVTAPRINLLVEFFPDASLVDGLLTLKQRLGDQFLFGVICTEDLADPIVWRLSGEARLAGLRRLLPSADFVWTLIAPEPYRAVVGADRVAPVAYGFSPRLVPFGLDREASLERDIDVLIYGTPYRYRTPVREALQAMGHTCDFTVGSALVDGQVQTQGLPRFLADEMLARTKVLVDMRRGPEVRALSVTRVTAALHAGCAVVAEEFEAGETAWLYRYTTPAAYERLAETCAGLLRDGSFLARGRQATERFRAETSMRDNMARALDLPFFRRFDV